MNTAESLNLEVVNTEIEPTLLTTLEHVKPS